MERSGPSDHAGAMLLCGASGRVGRLLSRVWRHRPPPGGLVRQVRTGAETGALAWAPDDGPDALLRHVQERGPIATMLVFTGIVREDEHRRFADDARLADACLAAADAAGVRRCLVASSAAIYGPGGGRPFVETDPPAPASGYGRAKRETERVTAAWRGRGLEVTALRIGNVAGADALLGQVRPGAAPPRRFRLDRFPDGGGPVRSYIDPVTLAGVLETLAAAPEPPAVVNLAAPGAVSMSSLLEAAGLAWEWVPAPAEAVQTLTLDTARLAQIHPFRPEAGTAEGIVRRWREASS